MLTPPSRPSVKATISSKHLTATFTFKSKGATGYKCALVLKPTRKHAKVPAPRYVACGSAKTFKHLKKGRTYVLYARSVGPGGTSKNPTTVTFKVH